MEADLISELREQTERNLYAFVNNRPTDFHDYLGLLFAGYEEVISKAEKRRGQGPWGDGAQHCWAVCYIVKNWGGGIGSLATLIKDWDEAVNRGPGWVKDIAAQHAGLACGAVDFAILGYIIPEKWCDCCCRTKGKP